MTTGVTRWNPFAELDRLWPRDLFRRDPFWDDFFAWRKPSGEVVEWSPRCDVTEEDEAIIVEAEVPGVDPKQINVSVEGSTLTIRGEKQSETKGEEKGRTYSERFFGSFERLIAIPEGVDASKIEAKTNNGVLTVRIPRPATAKPEAKKIEIKVG